MVRCRVGEREPSLPLRETTGDTKVSGAGVSLEPLSLRASPLTLLTLLELLTLLMEAAGETMRPSSLELLALLMEPVRETGASAGTSGGSWTDTSSDLALALAGSVRDLRNAPPSGVAETGIGFEKRCSLAFSRWARSTDTSF
jgi:hypothetical protein